MSSARTGSVRRITLSELASATGGELFGSDGVVSGYATDSHEVVPGDLFIAIRGARVDGHDFARAAIQLGAAGCLVERSTEGPHVLVRSVVDALAAIAGKYRKEFQGPVVGITGSTGKTSTKEFVAAALSPLGPILKTPGNRNTEYTAPLIWTELRPDHRAAVIEMSMRGFGQIAHLASFSRPTIAVITNIGVAHVELVGSRDGVAQAKGEMIDALPSNGVVILWREDDYLQELTARAGARKVLTFGFSEGADMRVTRTRAVSWVSAEIEGELHGKEWSATIPAIGKHMGLNAACALLAAEACGVEISAAASALSSAELPPMRMQVLTVNGANILLDTYNASPPSMMAAIETLGELPVSGRRRAVIGEMRELGEHAFEAHLELGRLLETQSLDDVLFVGELTRPAFEVMRGHAGVAMAGSSRDVREFLQASREGDGVLVKGSRALELEKALEGLPA